MIEHETRVLVNLSIYVTIATESHPEDISEDTLKNILAENTNDFLKEIVDDLHSVNVAIDDWEFDEIKVIEGV